MSTSRRSGDWPIAAFHEYGASDHISYAVQNVLEKSRKD